MNAWAARAVVARKLGAGVCDEFAAVVLFHLQKQLPVADRLYRLSVTVGEGSHAVVVLGDPGLGVGDLIRSGTSVVVDAWPTSPFAVRAVDWVYRAQPMQILLSLAGGEDYLKVVRAVYKKPFLFNEEECYRGIGDIRGSATSYKEYMDVARKKRAQAKLGLESQEPASGNPWGKMWDDEDSLDKELKAKLKA